LIKLDNYILKHINEYQKQNIKHYPTYQSK
jgi:hypothetical protein